MEPYALPHFEQIMGLTGCSRQGGLLAVREQCCAGVGFRAHGLHRRHWGKTEGRGAGGEG